MRFGLEKINPMSFVKDYFLVVIFFILPLVFVIQPLFLSKLKVSKRKEDLASLKRKKVLLYRRIKELEMEYDIRNINEEDFTSRRDELKHEVSEIMLKIKVF